MEYTREHRFSVYVDTNKRTIEESFGTLGELVAYVRELAESSDALACLLDGENA